MKQNAKILIIDDDADILHTSRMALKKHFTNIQTERHPENIIKLLGKDDYDVILLDMNFKAGVTTGNEGIEWLRKIKSVDSENNVVMITAYGDINLAVKAMKEGAMDFVIKPWDNKKLVATVMAAFKLSQSKKELKKYKSRESTLIDDIDKPYSQIIGESESMKNVYNIIAKVSKTNANVLILGENGTGKELIAREIHRRSERAEQIFISVDLGALPESLFESELFGYMKGSFTDARQDKPGRFEVASGGTLFLDEIGNLSLPLQSKLLSALQNRKIYRLGSNKPINIDIRLISATNMPLYEMIEKREFRDDLLYRINTVEIHIPPLRNRTGDIPLLCKHFLNMYSKKYKNEKINLSREALKQLEKYSWPGNIRELQHVIERAIIMADKQLLKPEDLFITNEESIEDNSSTLNIEELEKNAIRKALKKHSGNLSNAAKELGLGRTTLYRKIEKYGI